MLAFKNISTSRKLLLAFCLTAAGVGMGGVAIHQTAAATDAANASYDELLDRARATDALERAVLARSTAAMALVQQRNDGAEAQFKTAGSDLSAAVGALQGRFLSATDTARLERLKSLDADFRSDVDHALGGAVAAPAAPARARTEILAAPASGPDAAPMLSLVRSLRESEESALATALAHREEARATANTTLPLAIGFPLVLAGLSCALLLRGIASPLRRTSEELARLAEGASDAQPGAIGRADEIGALARTGEALRAARQRALALEAELASLRSSSANREQEAETERLRTVGEQADVVQAIQDGLTRLSGGDLTCRIEAEFPPRYAKLRNEFNAAVTHLHDMVGRVAQSVSSIANGTSEIGHASDDLSRRTEQQAASLDKTASALDEITATVKHSAENAASVASSVAAARQDTERSGEVMREAVDAMNAIQKSSQQIARIIGVIDEIAFQTNLLALNAGVEAARAGDAGRGFAVVALEVRALAQRSSEAAKEIKTLIGTSSTHVGNGVDLVNRSGEVLTRIAAQVTQIDALVQEIAGSAREQSIGIADVNDAVNKMDRVTQQNAAMVEETTAATLSLRAETEELGRLVSSFQVDGTNGAVAQLRSMSAAMKTTAKPQAAPAPAPRAAEPAPVARPVAVAAASGGGAAAAAAPSEDLGWEEF
ncbi:methyl-accepting chemotaxis protein [Aureimonas ureilytica]|uniref:methyl-accepting chemotaxis protein n=1 Tax=Aureimonas ureilytica TaxID=401562 RepID=UPI0003671E33|nr:methyl-accepting chemotaxis protein [Aureimonas ureilytica]